MNAARRVGAGLGPVLQVAAALLWIPQAGLLAAAIGAIADGAAVAGILPHAAGVVAIGVMRSGLDALGGRMTFRQARAALTDLRAAAARALAGRSPIDAGRPASGSAASTLAEQAEAVVPYLARFRPARLRATVVPAAILLAVAVWSWAAALVLLFAAPLIPIFMALIGWRAEAASRTQLAGMAGMNAFLLDRLRGLATIRALGAVDRTAERLHHAAEDFRHRTMAVLRIAFLSSAVLELFAALGVAMVAVYVGFHLLGQLGFGAWGGRLTLAEGLFVLLLAPAFFEPLRDLAAAWHDRAAGEAAIAALDRLALTGKGLPGGLEAQPIAPGLPAPAVAIEGLRFRHGPDSPLVFDGFALHVAPGERVALLAPSGCGKSTLLALLAGLVEPEAGTLWIGGERLSAGSAARLRRGMAWIGQRPHIFAGTLADNVALGRSGVDRATVDAALHAAGLAAVAAGRGTAPIGEGGSGLSGGEAPRLALARVAAAPEAGLILADEPTAHLDGPTARDIGTALLEIARDRTLVVATHDPALAARMDRIIRLAPAAERVAA